MDYKEEILKKIKALRDYQKLRQTNPDEALKFKTQFKVQEDYEHVTKFLSNFSGRKDGFFGDRNAFQSFVAAHPEIIPEGDIPNISQDPYGLIAVPEMDYEALFKAYEADSGKTVEELNAVYEASNPNIRANVHPLAEKIEAIKADADALFDANVAKELKASLDYANGEFIAKTGVDVLDKAISNNSDLPGIKAVAGFRDFVEQNGLDPNVVVNNGFGDATVSAQFNNESKFPVYKPFLDMKVNLDESYKEKILGLDRLLKEEGLLDQAAGGESGQKEYGLADYFRKNYALKRAILDHGNLQGEEQKRESLINIDRLSKELKDVSARYDKVFDYIEKNFDLENTSLSGNIYSGRPAEVREGGLEGWRPNLPPKYDFENSPKVIFLSGFSQLKAACQAGNVSLEEYVNDPIKAYQKGVKSTSKIGDERYYLPRSEENTLGKRLARTLVMDDTGYGHLAGYNMIGIRGMEFLTNTNPDKQTVVGNTIVSSINKEYNLLYDHAPGKYFGSPFEPEIDNVKNLFAFAHREDDLYKVSSHYYDENAVKGNLCNQYSQAVKERGNVPVEQEYRRIMDGMKDFAAERRNMHDHSDQFALPDRDGGPGELISHSLGTLLYAGREYFLDYMKENNLSLASIQDSKLRDEVTNFLTDPLAVLDKHIKPEDHAPESAAQIKGAYRSFWSNSKAAEAPQFFEKFNAFNNKPNGRNVGKTFDRIVSDNKGSWWERLRGKTSKEYSALQKVARGALDPESPNYGDDKALYVCAKAYKQYKMPEGTNFDDLSSTAKKRVEFCDSIIQAYEAKEAELRAQQEAPAEENVNENPAVQEEFQNQLRVDLDPQAEANNAPLENDAQPVNEKDPPEEGVQP